jgi:hypothetical protein
VDHPAERSDFREVKGIDRAPAGEQFENKSLLGFADAFAVRKAKAFKHGRQCHEASSSQVFRLAARAAAVAPFMGLVRREVRGPKSSRA